MSWRGCPSRAEASWTGSGVPRARGPRGVAVERAWGPGPWWEKTRKVCSRDCVECGEGHAASGALRMLRWSVVRAGSKHEELSSMHTRMSDLAWARVFRKPFRRPITFTRAARSDPAPHVRRSVGPVSYLLRPELRCSARSKPTDGYSTMFHSCRSRPLQSLLAQLTLRDSRDFLLYMLFMQ